MRKNFFPLRVTEPWPRLPREAVESPSLEIFQPRLDKLLYSLLWVTLLQQGVGLGDPQRSLPTPTILWFCKPPAGIGSGSVRSDGAQARRFPGGAVPGCEQHPLHSSPQAHGELAGVQSAASERAGGQTEGADAQLSAGWGDTQHYGPRQAKGRVPQEQAARPARRATLGLNAVLTRWA